MGKGGEKSGNATPKSPKIGTISDMTKKNKSVLTNGVNERNVSSSRNSPWDVPKQGTIFDLETKRHSIALCIFQNSPAKVWLNH